MSDGQSAFETLNRWVDDHPDLCRSYRIGYGYGDCEEPYVELLGTTDGGRRRVAVVYGHEADDLSGMVTLAIKRYDGATEVSDDEE